MPRSVVCLASRSRETTGRDDLRPGLGSNPAWAANVIAAVGNYGEIFNRNVGPDTALGLSRGVNALWTDGGLQYAPPYR